MNWKSQATSTEITALIIAADAQLSRSFQETLSFARSFQISGEISGYPAPQVLEMRLNQAQPQAVLIDLATDLEKAAEVIEYLANLGRDIFIIGLHHSNDSSAILRSLRAGATEFLHAPFDPAVQREVVARLVRMRQPAATEGTLDREISGTIQVFASAKPGAGSSTIAAQTAFAIRRSTNARVLLADFDLMGGAIGFYLKLEHRCSLLEALQHAEHLDPSGWNSITAKCGGVDILPAPVVPYARGIDANRLSLVLESARHSYDFVIVDLPMIFNRISMMAASQSDRAFLVTTSELPSLHLARKSVALLEQIGLPKERVQMLVNRISRRDGIGVADLEKLFNCPVFASLPNDYFSLHRVITLGQPLGPEGELGKSFDSLAAKMLGPSTPQPAGKRASAPVDGTPRAAASVSHV
jgi:pilus assembly protein CpaE